MIIIIGCFSFIEPLETMQKYKIQPTKTNPTHYNIAKFWVSLNIIIIICGILFAAFFTPFYGFFSINEGLFNWTDTLWQVPLFFISEDIFFYSYHIAFHQYQCLYNFHKIHHIFKSPFPLCTYAIHPIELFAQSLASMILPICLKPHIYVWWIYLILRNLSGIEDHLGYQLPYISLSYYFPQIFGGATFHDLHHLYFNGNFASFLVIIDSYMNTQIHLYNPLDLLK
eukprot:133694_1